MTVAEILEQAKALSPQERKELAKSLIDMLDAGAPAPQPKTGAEIVAMLQGMDPVEFVDPQIDDPVDWIRAQRRKRQEKRQPDRDSDS
jgi:hypothetical protein